MPPSLPASRNNKAFIKSTFCLFIFFRSFFVLLVQAKDFGFTRVFSSKAGQPETYESTMRPLVDDVFASKNALLFAYGMTNAGKTYTVLGEEGSPGLIPQALT